jgi:hypothetical protein
VFIAVNEYENMNMLNKGTATSDSPNPKVERTSVAKKLTSKRYTSISAINSSILKTAGTSTLRQFVSID